MKCIGIFALLPLLTSCGLFSSPMEEACEEVLLERLLAPQSYKPIEVQKMEFAMPRAEFEEWLKSSEARNAGLRFEMQRFDAGELNPVRFVLAITYNALNRRGEIVKETAVCQYADEDGDASGAAYYNVYVNGLDKNDYLAEQIKRLGK